MPRFRMVAHPAALTATPAPAGVVVRELTNADHEAASACLLAGYEGTSESEPDDDDQEVQRFATGVYGPPVPEATFVAETATGEIVGISLVCMHEGDPLLAHVVVRPDWQKRGLASRLIGASAEGLQRVSEDPLYLAVGAFNQPAARTYARLGFAHYVEGCDVTPTGTTYPDTARVELLEECVRVVPNANLARAIEVRTLTNRTIRHVDPIITMMFAFLLGEYEEVTDWLPIRASEIDAAHRLLPFGPTSPEAQITRELR